MKKAILPLKPVATLDNQRIPNVDIDLVPLDLIFPNMTVKGHIQTSIPNVKILRNTVTIKKFKPHKKNVYTEVCGSETSTKNIIKAQPNKNILPNIRFDPSNHTDSYMGTWTRTG